MLIHELDVNTDVIITAVVGLQKIEFNTRVLNIDNEVDIDILEKVANRLKVKKVLPIKAVRIDNKIVSFVGEGVTCQIVGTKDNRPYLWENVIIPRVYLPNTGNIHVLACDIDTESINRRENYRLWLGVDSTVQLGPNKTIQDAIVKDISTSGIGIIISSEYNFNIGDTVNVKFRDENSYGKEVSFNLSATVVRVYELNDTTQIIGCKFEKYSSQIARFIYDKQQSRKNIGRTSIYRRSR